MIHTNELMKEVLEKSQGFSLDGYLDNIQKMIWPRFIEREDGLVLNYALKRNHKIRGEKAKRIPVSDDNEMYDLAYFESSNNGFNIDDFIKIHSENTEEIPMIYFQIGLLMVEVWSIKLKSQFPTYTFQIVLSFDGEYTNISFWRVRENEQSLLAPIHEFKLEAVLLKEV